VRLQLEEKISATLLGVGALCFWALSPLLVYFLRPIPVFQLSAISFLIAFFLIAVRLSYTKRWDEIRRQPPSIFFFGFAAVFVNHVSYIAAIKWIPPEQAEIIYYLWPIMLILISGIALKEKKSWVTFLSAFLGLCGIYILFSGDETFEMFSWSSFPGYFLVLLAALMWAGYSLMARSNPTIPLEMSGIWCGMAGLLCLFLHFYTETAVVPTLAEIGCMVALGAGILTLSLFMWVYGLRYGYHDALSVFAYMTPVFSVILLIATGCCSFRVELLYSSFLVFLGGSLSCLKISFSK